MSRDVSLGSRDEAVMPWSDLAVLSGAGIFIVLSLKLVMLSLHTMRNSGIQH